MQIQEIKYDIVTKGNSTGKPCIKLFLDTSFEPKTDEDIIELIIAIRESTDCVKRLYIEGNVLEQYRELVSMLHKLGLGWEVILKVKGDMMPDYFIRQKANFWEVEINKESLNTDVIMAFNQMDNSMFDIEILNHNAVFPMLFQGRYNIKKDKINIIPKNRTDMKIIKFCLDQSYNLKPKLVGR